MAVAIMISTFGCNNGLILAGARAYYAMARDRLFFARAGTTQRGARCPRGAWGCRASGRRRSCCHAPITRPRQQYGNLYGNLLDYVVSAALLFYILTIARCISAARHATGRGSTLPRVRLPGTSGALHRRRAAILLVLLVYRPATTWPGFLIVLLGLPVFAWLRRSV